MVVNEAEEFNSILLSSTFALDSTVVIWSASRSSTSSVN